MDIQSPLKNTYMLNVIVLEDNTLFVQTEFLLLDCLPIVAAVIPRARAPLLKSEKWKLWEGPGLPGFVLVTQASNQPFCLHPNVQGSFMYACLVCLKLCVVTCDVKVAAKSIVSSLTLALRSLWVRPQSLVRNVPQFIHLIKKKKKSIIQRHQLVFVCAGLAKS